MVTFHFSSLSVVQKQPKTKKFLSLEDGKNRIFAQPDSQGNLRDDAGKGGKKIYKVPAHTNIFA